jgi:hypothetical protein
MPGCPFGVNCTGLIHNNGHGAYLGGYSTNPQSSGQTSACDPYIQYCGVPTQPAIGTTSPYLPPAAYVITLSAPQQTVYYNYVNSFGGFIPHAKNTALDIEHTEWEALGQVCDYSQGACISGLPGAIGQGEQATETAIQEAGPHESIGAFLWNFAITSAEIAPLAVAVAALAPKN